MPEMTLAEIIADSLDGILEWREMTTKELANILADRLSDNMIDWDADIDEENS